MFMVSGLAFASASAALTDSAADPPVIPPRLSKPRLDYYRAHPDEYQQFLSRLPARRLAPVPWPPATAARDGERAGGRDRRADADDRRHGDRAQVSHRV